MKKTILFFSRYFWIQNLLDKNIQTSLELEEYIWGDDKLTIIPEKEKKKEVFYSNYIFDLLPYYDNQKVSQSSVLSLFWEGMGYIFDYISEEIQKIKRVYDVDFLEQNDIDYLLSEIMKLINAQEFINFELKSKGELIRNWIYLLKNKGIKSIIEKVFKLLLVQLKIELCWNVKGKIKTKNEFNEEDKELYNKLIRGELTQKLPQKFFYSPQSLDNTFEYSTLIYQISKTNKIKFIFNKVFTLQELNVIYKIVDLIFKKFIPSFIEVLELFTRYSLGIYNYLISDGFLLRRKRIDEMPNYIDYSFNIYGQNTYQEEYSYDQDYIQFFSLRNYLDEYSINEANFSITKSESLPLLRLNHFIDRLNWEITEELDIVLLKTINYIVENYNYEGMLFSFHGIIEYEPDFYEIMEDLNSHLRHIFLEKYWDYFRRILYYKKKVEKIININSLVDNLEVSKHQKIQVVFTDYYFPQLQEK